VGDSRLLLDFVIVLPLLLVSLVLHELAHGWAAAALGDDTAKAQGRLSWNPLRQLDPLGTLILVASFLGSGGQFFFGWARPVPISPWRFSDPQRGMMLVGAAGPLANVALAALSCGLTWATWTTSATLAQVFALAFVLNVVLATINLVPIPPLDGSRVVGGLLPRSLWGAWMALDRFGNYVFILLFVVLISQPRLFEATIGRVLDAAMGLLP
jgi:Zn-dependent protease